ncbi:MAG: nucleotide sugar dehydrogenase [Candidatus Omnitrophota bacterium]|jgi:UDP-N-acetyl-D-glucosamine dehydrogenase|nr:MAG: nucleotide sugar dehydrogenase [Candidatus Omnitrophota bacterium]
MENFVRQFRDKVKKKQLKIGVVGLGYVGLPLAIEFAKKGFSVTGIEVDTDRLSSLKKKISYITDVSTVELRCVVDSGALTATCDFGVLKKIDVVIICVPTPLKKKYLPDISYIKTAVRAIAGHLKKKALVILESTTYPGTTEEVIRPLFEARDLRHGRDFYLCFSPERIDPGNTVFPVHKITKVVGGIDKTDAYLAGLVYGTIIEKVELVSSVRVAEFAKLLENTFRLVNIGLIDEIAMMCHKMDVKVWEVIKAAKTKPFGFMPFYPGPGVGGHCIPKDPLYLYWKAKKFGFSSRFIRLASDIISYMPAYVTSRVADLLRKKNKSLQKAKILVVGVTYKKDIKDLRKSPALDIIGILQEKRCAVSYYDPLIPYLKFNDIDLISIKLTPSAIKRFDCVIIATDHSRLDYAMIAGNAKLVFDTRNVYNNLSAKNIFLL